MLSVIIAIASINAVAGDRSAELGYVTGPTEQDRIRGHLLYAHATLAATDASGLPPSLREARARNLERLLAYARAGQFPRNDGHPDARRPTFVDADGDICAVGALYASDRGFPEAARISRDFKYAFIPQIVDADLHAWQRTSGLTPDELALIQPAYRWEDEPYYAETPKLHKPWGLTDRALPGPSRFGVTTEVSGFDGYDTLTTTFYGHTALSGRTDKPWGSSVYLSMPFGFVLAERDSDLAAAGGSIMTSDASHWYGNGDVGVFVGREDRDEGTASLVRFGALLPTATDHATTSMRVGDFVQELPRSYGARISHTRMVGWSNRRGTTDYAVRFDAGFDYARAVQGEHAQHFVPRANLGLLVSKELVSLSLDTAIAHVFDDNVEGSLRWSGGTTIRLTTPCGFQPGLTFAAVRTTEGWGGAFALEIAMAPH